MQRHIRRVFLRLSNVWKATNFFVKLSSRKMFILDQTLLTSMVAIASIKIWTRQHFQGSSWGIQLFHLSSASRYQLSLLGNNSSMTNEKVQMAWLRHYKIVFKNARSTLVAVVPRLRHQDNSLTLFLDGLSLQGVMLATFSCCWTLKGVRLLRKD